MNQDKPNSAIIISNIISKIQLILGVVLTAFFGLMTVVGLFMFKEGELPFVIFCLITTLLGIYLIKCGLKRNKFIKLFKGYVTILSIDQSKSLDNLAAATNTSVDVVQANIKEMIKKEFIANAYIDLAYNRLVFAGQQPPMSTNTTVSNTSSSEINNNGIKEYKTITCSSCGANNKILEGSVSECDFCGSHLK